MVKSWLTINSENMSNELTIYDRQKLQFWLRSKMSLRRIAKEMCKDHSIIIREINRNSSGRDKYRADTAQRLCDKRKHKQHKGKLDKYPNLKKYVEEQLKEGYSPEQIEGVLKKQPPPETTGIVISHESIYLWIYEKSKKHKKLYTYLRRGRSKRRKRGKRRQQKIANLSKNSIHKRPESINERIRFGDWEADTVEFKKRDNNPYLSVLYERKSHIVRINKIARKTADETNNAIIKSIESFPKDMFKTITFDNGSEFAKHGEIKEMFEIDTYFCDPYCSWQKGGVENINGLIRQYFPRNVNMNEITNEQIYEVQEHLNNRPRKSLNYLSPNEFILKSGALKT